MQTYQTACKYFVAWCRPRLGLKGRIHVLLVNRDMQHGMQKTFGYYDPQTQQIVISCKDRHPTDVLRTLAHELVHRAQAQLQDLSAQDGETGSPIENEANALAGILLRLYNQENLGQ
jgi:Zn-dependent peptidase ImmA (M78 family)